MSKVLSDKELGDIIYKAVNDYYLIDDADSYRHFLEDLAVLVTDHFGGDVSMVDVGADDGWYVNIHHNECVPEDGGVYRDYDQDMSIENWVLEDATDRYDATTDRPEEK